MPWAENVLTNGLKIIDVSKGEILQLNSSLINQMIKVLSCRFQQCLRAVTMLTAEGCSQKEPFKHLSNRIFPSQEYWKNLTIETHLLCQNI